jgi:hypothetical protein
MVTITSLALWLPTKIDLEAAPTAKFSELPIQASKMTPDAPNSGVNTVQQEAVR